MKSNRDLAVSDDEIAAFWQWFSNHHGELERLLDQNKTAELTKIINAKVNRLSPELAWEIGPGLLQPYMLALPAEGDVARHGAIERIMDKAPKVHGWEFHASRPTRPFQPRVELADRGLTFQTSDWKFTLDRSPRSDRFNLRIFDDHLATFDEKTALTAVFILLDAVLGEDMVERWIGDIKVLPCSEQRVSLSRMPMISERIAELLSK